MLYHMELCERTGGSQVELLFQVNCIHHNHFPLPDSRDDMAGIFLGRRRLATGEVRLSGAYIASKLISASLS